MHSFNPELQLKDTEIALRNKLINILTEYEGFKFVMTLVSEFKKIENDNKTKLLMKVTLMMYLNQSIVLLNQTCNNF